MFKLVDMLVGEIIESCDRWDILYEISRRNGIGHWDSRTFYMTDTTVKDKKSKYAPAYEQDLFECYPF